MPRYVEITVRHEATNDLLATLASRPEVISLKVERGVSLRPPGDVVSLVVANRWLPELHRTLAESGVGGDDSSVVTTAETMSVIHAPLAPVLQRDTNDATWEEMDAFITSEAGVNANVIGLMAFAGVLTGIGLSTGALHLVLAGMVVAPGFEPIARVGLAITTGGRTWRHGLMATLLGYTALFSGALAAGLVIRLMGYAPIGERAEMLTSSALVSFWSTLSGTSLLVSAAAGLAGSLLINANRSELTIGAMIGLALIPSLSLVPLALLDGDPGLAARGLLRWSVDVLLVLVTAGVIFTWKRMRVQRRQAVM